MSFGIFNALKTSMCLLRTERPVRQFKTEFQVAREAASLKAIELLGIKKPIVGAITNPDEYFDTEKYKKLKEQGLFKAATPEEIKKTFELLGEVDKGSY